MLTRSRSAAPYRRDVECLAHSAFIWLRASKHALYSQWHLLKYFWITRRDHLDINIRQVVLGPFVVPDDGMKALSDSSAVD